VAQRLETLGRSPRPYAELCLQLVPVAYGWRRSSTYCADARLGRLEAGCPRQHQGATSRPWRSRCRRQRSPAGLGRLRRAARSLRPRAPCVEPPVGNWGLAAACCPAWASDWAEAGLPAVCLMPSEAGPVQRPAAPGLPDAGTDTAVGRRGMVRLLAIGATVLGAAEHLGRRLPCYQLLRGCFEPFHRWHGLEPSLARNG